MKIPRFIRDNIVLKITSLNAVVITIRLVISGFTQWLLSTTFGETGIARIGQVRNIMGMLTSISSLGIFNGIVKYVAEHKNNKQELNKLFSTTTVFVLVGSLISGTVLFFGAAYFSSILFKSNDFAYVFKAIAFLVPFIAINRALNGIVNGLSEYKNYARIELISYLLSAMLFVVALYNTNLEAAILAIAVAPVIQLGVIIVVFGKVVKRYVDFKKLRLGLDYKNSLLAFTLMSFVSTFLLNYIELSIIGLIENEININEAGYWTAVTFISKNYMVFASGLFTLYVIPRFANIYTKEAFKSEVFNIYKTILPIFGLGMFLVYLLRYVIIDIIYPDFKGMEPLFKWQLLGDFVRLCSLIIAHQFLAKRMVKSFVITEVISLVLFYVLTILFINYFSTEGVVIAHLVRYIIYFVVVSVVIVYSFKNTSEQGNKS
ncbi:O-antigen translocase [Winogradskyella sp. HB-48]|uniref:O-antigen translocase n=1 Tax=Winogradskyella sp. HB-48 TaxID=3416808 RepID=UPI003CED2EDB